MKLIKVTYSYSLIVLISLMFIIRVEGQNLKKDMPIRFSKDLLIKFEVLSARIMTPEESFRKQSDNIAIDVSVKVRLSNLGQRAIYYYTGWKEAIIPYGNTVKETEKGIVWLKGLYDISEKSLGIRQTGSGGWLLLLPETSIEWELFDTTVLAGEKHAHTVYIKFEERGDAIEIISDFYEVPSKKSLSKD